MTRRLRAGRSWKAASPPVVTNPGRHHVARRGALRRGLTWATADLWRIDDPTAPGGAVLEGSFPSGRHEPWSVITSHGGALYVVDNTPCPTLDYGG